MPSVVYLFIILVLALAAFVYLTYRSNISKRVKRKKPNQYNDRV